MEKMIRDNLRKYSTVFIDIGTWGGNGRLTFKASTDRIRLEGGCIVHENGTSVRLIRIECVKFISFENEGEAIETP